MQVWGRTQPLGHYPYVECLDVIAGLGFEGVEVCFENNDLEPAKLTEELLLGVRSSLDALGLVPFSASYHKDYVYDDQMMDETVRSIRAARTLGAGCFVFAGTRKVAADEDEWARSTSRIHEFVKVAEDEGVVLALEFEPNFIVGSTAELLRLFEEIPSPYLQANLDLGHLFLCDPDPIASIHAVGGERIAHVHIENMAADVHDHLLPHEGDMDLGAYIRALREVGYDGCLTLDLYRHEYEKVAPDAIAYINGLIRAG